METQTKGTLHKKFKNQLHMQPHPFIIYFFKIQAYNLYCICRLKIKLKDYVPTILSKTCSINKKSEAFLFFISKEKERISYQTSWQNVSVFLFKYVAWYTTHNIVTVSSIVLLFWWIEYIKEFSAIVTWTDKQLLW